MFEYGIDWKIINEALIFVLVLKGTLYMAAISQVSESRALSQLSTLMKQADAHSSKKACKRAVDVWAQCKTSEKVLGVVVFLLTEHGQHEQAITILQEAITINGETSMLLQLMGKVAIEMGTFDVGEKLFSRAILLEPTAEKYYVNLITCLRQQDKNEEALELVKAALEQFPENASLWNALGILAKDELRDELAAREFFRQAIALDKENGNYYHNMGLVAYPNSDAQRFWLYHALHLEPENSQFNLTYSFYLFAKGRMQEAWEHYWYRRDSSLGINKASEINQSAPLWNGECLKGKTIFICAEQGIGDEVFFLMALKKTTIDAEMVLVVCDPRLVQLVERSYENCKAFPYEDTIKYGVRYRHFPLLDAFVSEGKVEIDYFALMGDLMHYGLPTKAEFLSMRGGYFIADDCRVEKYKRVLLGSKRKKIGISWRSGNLKNERKYFYLSLRFFAELSQMVDADYYVLQYTMDEDEREFLKSFTNIKFFDGLDLKNDIEANIAIMFQLDLVLGPPVATQQFALAADVPVWLFNRGKPWYFLDDDHIPAFFPKGSKWWVIGKDECLSLEDVADELKCFIQ